MTSAIMPHTKPAVAMPGGAPIFAFLRLPTTPSGIAMIDSMKEIIENHIVHEKTSATMPQTIDAMPIPLPGGYGYG